LLTWCLLGLSGIVCLRQNASFLAFDAQRFSAHASPKRHERLSDSQLAFGRDRMNAALEGDALLKIAGKGQALETARQALSESYPLVLNNVPRKLTLIPSPPNRLTKPRAPSSKLGVPRFKAACAELKAS
jgi:hypothetical protein